MFGARTMEMTGLGIASDSEWLMFQIFAAVRRGGRLATIEFAEANGGMDGVKAVATTSWDAPVPANASVWAATAGVTASAARQYWVGWRDQRQLAALALTQEHPILCDLAEGETLIAPPLLMADGSLHQLAWRPSGEGRRALWRHVFRGALHTPGTVESTRLAELAEIDGLPVASIAEPVPGRSMFGASPFQGGGKRAVVGWIEATGDGSRMAVATLEGADVHIVRSALVPGTVPLPHQRPGLRLDPDGAIELAAMGERPGPRPSYVTLQLPIAAHQADTPSVRVQAFAIGEAKLAGAAAHYLKGARDRDGPRWFAVTDQGALVYQSLDGEPPQITRRDVPPTYPFPLLATAGQIYEAFPTTDGDVEVRPYGEGR